MYEYLFNPMIPFNNSFVEVREFDGFAFKILKVDFRFANFTSPNFKDKRGISSFACCKVDRFHIPPVWDCECGLYSLKSLRLALSYLRFRRGYNIFKVEIEGEIVEHNLGYRSMRESIRSIYLPKNCPCGSFATYFFNCRAFCSVCARKEGREMILIDDLPILVERY